MKLNGFLTGGVMLFALAACGRDESEPYGQEDRTTSVPAEREDFARAAEERAQAAQDALADGAVALSHDEHDADGADGADGLALDDVRPREASFSAQDAEDKGPSLVRVDLQPVGDSGVRGVILFERTEEGVHVTGRIEGLTPGKHGFHVHEFGDLSDTKTGNSAGSHFAPGGTPHGLPDSKTRHAGDLGNVTAGEDGVALVDHRDAALELHGERSIVGRALVVHANPDDGGQPTGNAGGRVAFGVVGIANPAAPR